jgi:glutamate N-acetyltransferase/amino-acid N-acetyltransferase
MSLNGSSKPLRGGVTAARGFRAAGVSCGLRPPVLRPKPDLAIVCSDGPAVAAATFTTNKIKAAPVKVSAAHLAAADVRAVVLNAANANAATGLAGIEHARRMVRATAGALGLRERQVLVCSTGRIGIPLPIERIEKGVPGAVAALSLRGGTAAARAIMTSDTFPKEFAVREILPGGQTISIGGMAKGAGMIDPNMATMLCVLTTDAAVPKKDLQRALSASVQQSFNRITVDGDMSTNDTVILLANGQAGSEPCVFGSQPFAQFQAALDRVTRNLARLIVEDGEGASRFVEVRVSGAASSQDARKAAEAVANSALVKCSWHGGDPNWGRILDAVGYSSAAVREEMVDVYYNGLIAVKGGVASRTPRAKLAEVVREKKFTVHVHLGIGDGEYCVYTTDLSPQYVRFNQGE